MKRYAVKDIFLTVQGEGSRAGCSAVFVRLAGCNAWSGDPAHRNRDYARTGAECARWCDTDFRVDASTARLTAPELAQRVAALQPTRGRRVVITGGEPLLQVDAELMAALNLGGALVSMETNGSVLPAWEPEERDVILDLLTVSPKRGLPLALVVDAADHARRVAREVELKVVLPGAARGDGWSDLELAVIAAKLQPDHLYVQPQDPVDPETVSATRLVRGHGSTAAQRLLQAQFVENVRRCLGFVHANPAWRLSCQTHKFLGLP